ncbi:group I truncated hemoglobin [Rhodopirellula halodulae]|uniref:group I truncated hemoglobin n=1 Tax=Rhodopirellula halodulae TaxID=2894198 RepID=UPI001E4308B3|nr:group 1 truncated hemoglobin [Rhodopirellula sp. JC737]MCC9657133.1 group 1 truncated hemoglobin [Rhodopirellula sp. JC737]
MSQTDADLLNQLGGMDGVRHVVDDMYVRVLADPELTHFFDGVPMEKLSRMQTEFIASMTSGDIQYTGADLTKVHAGRGITGAHFSRFCGHLTDAMEAKQVSSHAIDQVLGKLAMYSDKITGSSNVDG